MKFSKSNMAVAAWILLVIIFATYFLKHNAAPTQTTMKSIGSVLAVKDCTSGRNSHSCNVLTTSHQWVTDLGHWPGEILQPGDQLAMRIDLAESRKETWMCRNETCRAISVCWRWMPCWDRAL